MKHVRHSKRFSKTLSLLLLGGILMCSVSGCKTRSDIEGYFADLCGFYPTSDLMSFFDRHISTGDPEDKGTWIISSMYKSKIQGPLRAEGVVLYFNRNKNLAKGFYIITQYRENKNLDLAETKYPIYYDETGIHLKTDIEDQALKNKILNFKFLVQYMDFNEDYISSLDVEDSSYNPNVPFFSIKYSLNKQDSNLVKLSQFNPDVLIGDNPALQFEGSGELSSQMVSQRSFTIYCNEKQYIDESISFHESGGQVIREAFGEE